MSEEVSGGSDEVCLQFRAEKLDKKVSAKFKSLLHLRLLIIQYVLSTKKYFYYILTSNYFYFWWSFTSHCILITMAAVGSDYGPIGHFTVVRLGLRGGGGVLEISLVPKAPLTP